MPPFRPLFRSPHLQTILGYFWKRPDVTSQYPTRRWLCRTEPDVQVLVQSQRPAGRALGDIVLIHGLEGSSEAGYMLSMSAAALAAGFATHRFNIRTCGGTEKLCNTLYHAGLTSDLLAVIREIGAPVFLVGFSLGGNIALKLAGELGTAAGGTLRAVCAISTPLDLALCAHRITEPDNRLYQRRFVSRMQERLLATGRYSARDFASLRSVREIDDRITAPSFGFGDASTYYRTQSAIGYLDAICVPTLLIQAKDDTFIPFSPFESEAVRTNPFITLLATERGGHVGFIGRKPHRFWLDNAVVDWISTHQSDLDRIAKEQPAATSRIPEGNALRVRGL